MRRGLKRLTVLIAVAGTVLAGTSAQAAVSPVPANTPGFNGAVWAVAYAGDTIYVGGDFTAALVNGKPVTRNRLAAISAKTGSLLSWAPEANGQVRAIAASGGSVYIGGSFSAISGVKRDSLARLNGTSGAVHSSFNHSLTGQPYARQPGWPDPRRSPERGGRRRPAPGAPNRR